MKINSPALPISGNHRSTFHSYLQKKSSGFHNVANDNNPSFRILLDIQSKVDVFRFPLNSFVFKMSKDRSPTVGLSISGSENNENNVRWFPHPKLGKGNEANHP